MAKENKTIEVNDREKRVIRLVTLLNDKQLFGLECFVAGMGVRGTTEEKTDCQQEVRGAVV